METLNIEEMPRKARRPGLANRLWNTISLLALLGVVGWLGAFWIIFNNPYSAWNPFPPPTLPAALGLPTDTPTPVGMLPPTWTPAPTAPSTPTETARPTATLPPTPTFFSLVSATPAPLTDANSAYPYVVKERPLPLPNIAHSDKGCNWLGVAGTVEDLRGGPKTQLIVVLGGSLAGRLVHSSGVQYSLTGVAPAYGQAGYEFVLAEQPVDSKSTLWIQLVDQTEKPLSEKVYFDTFNDCEKNLIVLSFKQVR